MTLIELRNVSKYFSVHKNYTEKIRRALSNNTQYFCALNNVSLRIKEGESLGIIGLNGAGKSTLSNVLCGLTRPSKGELISSATVSLLGVGVGLNAGLTGADNIIQKCLLLGFSKKEIDALFDDVVAFSELEDFIHLPVSSYSSGMRSRLGFAISIQLDPDVLVIDEALSVGDNTFYNKCVLEIEKRKEKGKSIVFVSHSLSQIETMCDRVVWLNYGAIIKDGAPKEVVSHYKDYIREYKLLSRGDKKASAWDERLIEKSAIEKSDKLQPDVLDIGILLSLVCFLVKAALLIFN